MTISQRAQREAEQILAGRAATDPVRRLVALAVAKGLRPSAELARARGLYRVVMNGEGRDALFGAIYISARTGKFLRAWLCEGNGGTERFYDKLADVRALLRRQRVPRGGGLR